MNVVFLVKNSFTLNAGLVLTWSSKVNVRVGSIVNS